MNYDPLIELLTSEKTRINKEIAEIDKWLQGHEIHNYRVRRKNNHFYYSIEVGGKENYVSTENEHILSEGMKTCYLARLKPQLEEDLRHIDSMLRWYHPERRSKIYSGMSEGRKRYVKPLYENVEDRLSAFSSVQVPPMVYPGSIASFRTQKGEMVRSKSELYIADALFQNNIPYHYEMRKTVGNQIVYPDFTVMNPRSGRIYIWEHFGRMGDPKYSADTISKINRYTMNGFVHGKNLLMTFESESIPLNPDVVRAIIKRYLL